MPAALAVDVGFEVDPVLVSDHDLKLVRKNVDDLRRVPLPILMCTLELDVLLELQPLCRVVGAGPVCLPIYERVPNFHAMLFEARLKRVPIETVVANLSIPCADL